MPDTMKRLSGSAGNPVQDSSARGLIAAALTGLLAFAGDKSGWFSDQDLLNLTPFLVFVSFVLGGLFDRYVRPRLG